MQESLSLILPCCILFTFIGRVFKIRNFFLHGFEKNNIVNS